MYLEENSGKPSETINFGSIVKKKITLAKANVYLYRHLLLTTRNAKKLISKVLKGNQKLQGFEEFPSLS